MNHLEKRHLPTDIKTRPGSINGQKVTCEFGGRDYNNNNNNN